jgi:hypothetical protein
MGDMATRNLGQGPCQPICKMRHGQTESHALRWGSTHFGASKSPSNTTTAILSQTGWRQPKTLLFVAETQ